MSDPTCPEPGSSRLLELLGATWGYSSFRPLQREIIEATLAGRDVFALMPTGGGKSLCYQLPALERTGVTVVVSPLIALMKDQVDRLKTLGVSADFINSSLSSSEVGVRRAAVARGALKLLYVAPERLMMEAFLTFLASVRPAAFAIDEAHCISEWGHDFRPEYRALRRLRELFPSTPIAAFTATATPKVQADILAQLHLNDAARFRGSFDRANLFYEVRPKQEMHRELVRFIQQREGLAGIVYCQSRATTESVASMLQTAGIKAAAYHAGLSPDERRRSQEAFLQDDLQVIVATIAFGMGIDKPDVRFVVHYDLPKNLEGYYQESGRAGRDGEPSDCVLFYSYADVMKQEYFIRQRGTEAERQNGREQLQRVVDWAEARTCRRRQLLEYFDERLEQSPELCCDVCRGSGTLTDVTADAQRLLDCVKATGERFGLAYVIQVLRGSRDERILQLRHDRLPVHGSGRHLGRTEWHEIAEALVQAAYLNRSADQYKVLQLAPRGVNAVASGESILVPGVFQHLAAGSSGGDETGTPAASAPAGRSRIDPAVSVGETDAALFEELRKVRKRLADERSQAAFVVLHDASLRQMAAEQPETLAALQRIRGMGERKLVEFGDMFLRAMVAFKRQHPDVVATANPLPPPPPPRPLGRSDSMQATLALFQQGLDPAAIATSRKLSAVTVAEHLERALESGEAVDIRRLVDDAKIGAIEDALRELGPRFLKPLKERLGDRFGYDEIRYVRAAMERDARESPSG